MHRRTDSHQLGKSAGGDHRRILSGPSGLRFRRRPSDAAALPAGGGGSYPFQEDRGGAHGPGAGILGGLRRGGGRRVPEAGPGLCGCGAGRLYAPAQRREKLPDRRRREHGLRSRDQDPETLPATERCLQDRRGLRDPSPYGSLPGDLRAGQSRHGPPDLCV